MSAEAIWDLLTARRVSVALSGLFIVLLGVVLAVATAHAWKEITR